ncbi:MAG: M36 family metallopeptidase [Cyanobacteriota bacterium]
MLIQSPGGLRGLTNKLVKKEAVEKQETSKNNTETRLSFMSIPSIAFKGNMVIPVLPKGLKESPKPVIQKDGKSYIEKTLKEPNLKYLVYSQDPLVTPEPELYQHKGSVIPGPESNRIKTVDEKSEVAKPTEKGNYVADVNSPQFDRISSFLFSSKVLKMFEDNLGRKIEWAFSDDQLKIHPRAGVTMNAYYSRWEQLIKLFYFNSRTNPAEKCFTSKMADVITHETGHAVLDGLRPSYFGWGAHNGAVHEGFGDSVAMLAALDNENIVDSVIKQTGGDLKKENLIASLAEQFGKAVYGDKLYLRNAINDLKMSDFDSGRESNEEHNFGRLFGAMFYDMIVELSNDKATVMPLKTALKQTKDDLTKLMARAIGDFSPPGNVYYDDIAKAFLKADQHLFKGQYKDLLSKVFVNREILNNTDIKAWEAEQKSIPALTLPPKTLETSETILDFINKNKGLLGLPKDSQYKLESAYTNSSGETFVQLKAGKLVEIPSKDPAEEPKYRINVYGGLTLGFDKAGKLFYKAENKTRQFEINDAIKDAQKHLENHSKNFNITGYQPKVYLESEDSNLLIKAPIIEEPV